VTITVTTWRRPDRQYTPISNQFLRAKIPPAAFRVACYMLSHREGWELSQERIGKAIGMGRDTVGTALKKLEELGYVVRHERPREKGRIAGVRVFLSDVGFTDEDRSEIAQIVASLGNAQVTTVSENPTWSEGDEEKPQVEPMSENPTRCDETADPADSVSENPTAPCRKIQHNHVGKSDSIRRQEENYEEGGLREVGTSLARDPAKTPPSSESAPNVTEPGAGSAAPSIDTAYRRLCRAMVTPLHPRERDRALQLLTDGLSVETARSTLMSERKARRVRTESELAAVGEGSGRPV